MNILVLTTQPITETDITTAIKSHLSNHEIVHHSKHLFIATDGIRTLKIENCLKRNLC